MLLGVCPGPEGGPYSVGSPRFVVATRSSAHAPALIPEGAMLAVPYLPAPLLGGIGGVSVGTRCTHARAICASARSAVLACRHETPESAGVPPAQA